MSRIGFRVIIPDHGKTWSSKMTEGDVQVLSDKILQTVLGPDMYETSSVSAGYDDAGDASLFVVARLKHGADVISGRKAGDAIVALGHALEEAGEYRFPYLSFHYPDDSSPEPKLELAAK